MKREIKTIENTTLYRDFYKYVVDKFGSMSHFAKILHGDLYALNGIQNMIDNEKSRVKIWWMDGKAHELAYDKKKVFISYGERLQVQDKVSGILGKRKIKLSQYLREVKFNRASYDNITAGRNPYKNESYQKLMKILF